MSPAHVNGQHAKSSSLRRVQGKGSKTWQKSKVGPRRRLDEALHASPSGISWSYGGIRLYWFHQALGYYQQTEVHYLVTQDLHTWIHGKQQLPVLSSRLLKAAWDLLLGKKLDWLAENCIIQKLLVKPSNRVNLRRCSWVWGVVCCKKICTLPALTHDRTSYCKLWEAARPGPICRYGTTKHFM